MSSLHFSLMKMTLVSSYSFERANTPEQANEDVRIGIEIYLAALQLGATYRIEDPPSVH